MRSFSTIQRQTVTDCYDLIVSLFSGDQVKLLDAAEIALASDSSPFNKNAGDIAPQLATIRQRIDRIFNNNGRNILIKLIEALMDDITDNGGAIGVNMDDFLNLCRLKVEEYVEIKLTHSKRWTMVWDIPSQNGYEKIILPIREIATSSDDIVPDYILQYINQAITAYKKENYLTSLSLISIGLEGTLRDMLEVKGFTYVQGAPSEDTYELTEMEVNKDSNGFHVKLPNSTKDFNDFLTEPECTIPNIVRIKRIKRRNKWHLEIRDVEYLKEYWSSHVVTQQGQKNIGGLGTALNVARNEADFLTSTILAEDVDEVIQQVRNNLIHLSGSAMTNIISSVGVSLSDFASNQARVFDTIWSVCGAIDKLYSKKHNESL